MSISAQTTESQSPHTIQSDVPIIPPEAGFTKRIETQAHFDYEFAFGLADIESVHSEGLDVVITFQDSGVLILEGFVLSNMDLSNIDVSDGCLNVADSVDFDAVDLALANLEPDAGEQAPIESAVQSSEGSPSGALGNIEPAAGNSGTGNNDDNGGFSFVEPLTIPLEGVGAIGPLGQTSLSYNANFPTLDPFADLTDELVSGLLGGLGDDSTTPPGNTPPAEQGAASSTYDEDNIGDGPVEGQLDVDFGADGAGGIETNGDVDVSGSANNGTLTSNGQPVSVSATDSGYVGMDANGNPVFTLTIDPLTGEYEFTLLGPLDHADPNNPNDILNITFGFDVVDANGDSVSTTIDIAIADDGPRAFISFVAVDEADISDNGQIMLEGQAFFEAGADGVDSVSGNGDFQALYEVGGQTQTLTSNGSPIIVSLTADGNYQGVDANGNIIFTLTIDPLTGSYVYNQYFQIDHPGAGSDVIWLKFGYQVVDADGDISTNYIGIDVIDTEPDADDDDITVTSEDGNMAQGNVTDNDDVGSDLNDHPLTKVTFNDVEYDLVAGQTITINGVYGVLTISSDGTYTYDPYDGVSGQDEFIYTIMDGDGDTSEAALTFDVNLPPPPIVENGENNVYELVAYAAHDQGEHALDLHNIISFDNTVVLANDNQGLAASHMDAIANQNVEAGLEIARAANLSQGFDETLHKSGDLIAM